MLTLPVETKKLLDELKLNQSVRQKIDRGTARAADIVLGALRRFSLSGILHGRTGNLARMWQAPIRTGDASFLVSNASPYARIHEGPEDGGDSTVIVPTKSKMLAIPVGPALTDRGVPRFTSPRSVQDLFVFKSKAGNLMLAKHNGKDKLEAWYILKDKVTIPARRYATKAIESVHDRAVEEVSRAVQA